MGKKKPQQEQARKKAQKALDDEIAALKASISGKDKTREELEKALEGEKAKRAALQVQREKAKAEASA